MNKENQINIPEEVLKKIKSQAELDDYFHQLYKHAVESMLKAEMEEHLGYKKHEKTDKETRECSIKCVTFFNSICKVNINLI